MARIKPVEGTALIPDIKQAFGEHIKNYQARITNMKAVLGHSLTAFEIIVPTDSAAILLIMVLKNL